MSRTWWLCCIWLQLTEYLTTGGCIECLYYISHIKRRLEIVGSRIAAMAQKKYTQARFFTVFSLYLSLGFCPCAWHLMETRGLLQFHITSSKAKTTTKKVIFVLCRFISKQNSFPDFFFNPYSIRLLFISCWLELGYLPILNEPLAKDNAVIKPDLD